MVVCEHSQLLKGLGKKDLMYLGAGKPARATQQDPHKHIGVHVYTHVQERYKNIRLWSVHMWQVLAISKSK